MESLFKRATSTYIGSTTLLFLSTYLAECLGHFEFKTLLTLSSAFFARAKIICTRPSNQSYVWSWHKQEIFWDQGISRSAIFFQATIQVAGFLQVRPKSLFKRLMLSTVLWQHAKMSTTLKSPDGLKDLKCEKG
jgi:hypothetical protein